MKNIVKFKYTKITAHLRRTPKMFNPTTPHESTHYSFSAVIRKENSSFVKLLIRRSVDYLENQVLISGERNIAVKYILML